MFNIDLDVYPLHSRYCSLKTSPKTISNCSATFFIFKANLRYNIMYWVEFVSLENIFELVIGAFLWFILRPTHFDNQQKVNIPRTDQFHPYISSVKYCLTFLIATAIVKSAAHIWFTLLLHGTRLFEWWPVNCPFWCSSGKTCLGQKARTGKVHHLKTKIKLFLLVQNKDYNILNLL